MFWYGEEEKETEHTKKTNMRNKVRLAGAEVPMNKPTIKDFFWLIEQAMGLGYKVRNPGQAGKELKMQDIRVSDWVLKRSEKDVDRRPEVGLYYSGEDSKKGNDYKAKVWPSFVFEHQAYKEKDHGFALIENRLGNAVFWAPPVRRTKGFVKNLFGWSQISFELVHDRQVCPDPECGEWMHIYGSLAKGYYWKCINEELHGHRLPVMDIIVGLSKESIEFLEKIGQRWKRDAMDSRRKSKRRGSFGRRRTDKWQGNAPSRQAVR